MDLILCLSQRNLMLDILVRKRLSDIIVGMKKLLRLFLLCVLMLAIPLEGFAASAMPVCKSEPTPQLFRSLSVVHETQQKSHSSHHVVTADSVADGGHHSSVKCAGKGKYISCAACAVCVAYMGAAGLFTTPVVPDTIKPSAEKIIQTPFAFSGHIANVPERPPKA